MPGIGYWWKFRMLQRERQKILRSFAVKLVEVKKGGDFEKAATLITEEVSQALGVLDDKIKIMRTQELVMAASWYLVPIPAHYQWKLTKSGWDYLDTKDLEELRNAIRKEQNARREQLLAWIPLITALTGIGGVLVAILALLRKA